MTGEATVPAVAEMAPSSPRAAPAERPDPRRVALHRALRAAIVNPAVFAFTLLVIRNLQVATFAVFGCFGLLVMADFGGPRRPRALRLRRRHARRRGTRCARNRGLAQPLRLPRSSCS